MSTKHPISELADKKHPTSNETVIQVQLENALSALLRTTEACIGDEVSLIRRDAEQAIHDSQTMRLYGDNQKGIDTSGLKDIEYRWILLKDNGCAKNIWYIAHFCRYSDDINNMDHKVEEWHRFGDARSFHNEDIRGLGPEIILPLRYVE